LGVRVQRSNKEGKKVRKKKGGNWVGPAGRHVEGERKMKLL